jgi:hypothetical protein
MEGRLESVVWREECDGRRDGSGGCSGHREESVGLREGVGFFFGALLLWMGELGSGRKLVVLGSPREGVLGSSQWEIPGFCGALGFFVFLARLGH